MSGHDRSDADHDSGTTVALDPGLELARHLADIATIMLAPGATTAAQRILSLALATLESCDDAALCGGSTSPTGSATMVALDALQTGAGQGPCVDTLGGVDTVYVPELLDDQLWPLFSPEAVRHGFRSALAYRLSLNGETVGALQLYAQLPAAFNATERAQGLVFASYAALAIGLARAQEAEEVRIENLQDALSSREVIGQAQGILMERERITAEQAFQLLRRSSQHLNRKLRAVAQDIVDTGDVPSESRDRGPS